MGVADTGKNPITSRLRSSIVQSFNQLRRFCVRSAPSPSMVQKRNRKQNAMNAGGSAKRRKGANSKKKSKKVAERMSALRSALSTWRSSASAALSCSESLLCSDEMMDRLVQGRPTTIEELNSLRFGTFKALFFGSTLFNIIGQHWTRDHPRPSSEGLWKKIWSDDIDVSSIFQHTEETVPAATPPPATATPPAGPSEKRLGRNNEETGDVDIEGVCIPVEMACSSGDDSGTVKEGIEGVRGLEGAGKQRGFEEECSELYVRTPFTKEPQLNLNKGKETSIPLCGGDDSMMPASSQKSPKVVWSTTYELLTRFRSGEPQVVHSDEEVIAERVAEDFKARGGTSDGEFRTSKTRKRKSLEPELPFLPSRDPAPDLDCIKRQNDYYKEMAERLRAQERVKRMVDSWFETCLKNARTSSERAKSKQKHGSESRSPSIPYWIGANDWQDHPKNRQGLAFKKKPELGKLQLKGLQAFAREAGATPHDYKDLTTEELRPICSELVDQWEVNRILACKSLPEWRRCLVVLRLQGPQTLETAKSAFKKLTLVVHPDKNKSKGASEAFCLVTESLEWLCARV